MLSKFVYLITIDEVLILLPSGMGNTGIEKRSIRIRLVFLTDEVSLITTANLLPNFAKLTGLRFVGRR